MAINNNKIALLCLLIAAACSQTCFTGCLTCTDSLHCASCVAGGFCCQPSCNNCQNNGTVCGGCRTGYSLNSQNLCVLQNSCDQPFCSSCIGTACTSCSPQYVLQPNTNECLQCPINCKNCTINGVCSECLPTYFLTTTGACSACPTNCLTCASSSTCRECLPKFAVATNGTCQPCLPNCDYCRNLTACVTCSNGFYMTASGSCSPCTEPCTTCAGSSNNCTDCPFDSYLYNNSCIQCYKKSINCVACEVYQNSFSCLGCRVGYYLSSNNQTCLECSANCRTCNGLNNCAECEVSYYLNANLSCDPCTIGNCLQCSSANTCTRCAVGTYLSSNLNVCEPCLEGCAICTSQEQCQTCQDNYFPYFERCYPCNPECNQCLNSPSTCMACNTGFYHLTPYGPCLPCPDFCPVCSAVDKCLNCAAGYYLLEGACEPCATPNCLSCSNSGVINVCTLCMVGYYLNNGACTSCGDNCGICTFGASGNKNCTSCLEGYYLNGNACTPCEANCQSCSSASTCISCQINFYIDENQGCSTCPLGCAYCKSGTTCSECQTGFYWDFDNSSSVGECLRCDSPCFDCSQSADNCLICQPGYQLTGPGQCTSCSKGCEACDPSSGCLLCGVGYTRIVNMGSSICEPCPKNCVKCTYSTEQNSTVCSHCFYGYTPLENGNCFKCGFDEVTRGCLECSSTGECQTCMKGFSFTEEGVCQTDDYTEGNSVWGYIYAMISLSCALMLSLSTFAVI